MGDRLEKIRIRQVKARIWIEILLAVMTCVSWSLGVGTTIYVVHMAITKQSGLSEASTVTLATSGMALAYGCVRIVLRSYRRLLAGDPVNGGEA